MPTTLLPLLTMLLTIALLAGCQSAPRTAGKTVPGGISAADSLPRACWDAHAHLGLKGDLDPQPLIAELERLDARWLLISTIGTQWESCSRQSRLAAALHAAHPDRVGWVVSFNLENWNAPDWRDQAIRTIEQGFADGAVGVKVWKEIGMVLRDPDSGFVMIDDPRFDPILDYIESRGKTLVAHIGEPLDCWLPLDSMQVRASLVYYGAHPQYHAFLHPEMPHYWAQIDARDSLLAHHPGLRVVGAHLGSLEHDVDQLAARLERYPNFAVDLAARMPFIKVQDRDRVREFMLRYQDRVLYGTDLALAGGEAELATGLGELERTYREDWRYLAGDQPMEDGSGGMTSGLALPDSVLEKLYRQQLRALVSAGVILIGCSTGRIERSKKFGKEEGGPGEGKTFSKRFSPPPGKSSKLLAAVVELG